MKRRTDILNREKEIKEWINENRSNAFICHQLCCKPETLQSYYKKMGIVYKGNKGSKGFKQHAYKKTLDEYINSSCIKSSILKKKLIEDGLKEKKCDICGLSKWQDEDIPLELHHKDGNHFNNDINNLMVLCPNCHSLQHKKGTKKSTSSKQNIKNELYKEKYFNYVRSGQIRKDNHICPQKFSFEQIEERKKLILNSGIDFSKWGWGTKLSKILGISSQKAIKWLKSNMPEFYLEHCHK